VPLDLVGEPDDGDHRGEIVHVLAEVLRIEIRVGRPWVVGSSTGSGLLFGTGATPCGDDHACEQQSRDAFHGAFGRHGDPLRFRRRRSVE
jgi:hypothetical protein